MNSKLKSLPQFLKEIAKENKHILPLIFVLAIFQGLSPLINIILPRYILDELLELRRINVVFIYIGILAIGNFLFQWMISLFKNHLNLHITTLTLNSGKKLGTKAMRISLEESEKKTNLDLLERGRYGAYDISTFVETISAMGSSIITFLSAIFILLRNDWRLILITFVCSTLTIPCFNKIKELDIASAKRGIPENRAFRYLCTVATDFRFAKDLRLYNGDKFFIKKAKDIMDRILEINHEYFTKSGFWGGLAQAIGQVQLILIFVVLGMGLFTAKITFGTFTMLYGASNQLSKSINDLIHRYTNLITLSINLDPYYEFLNIHETKVKGVECDEIISRPVSLEFQNISFRYPTGEESILKNINFKINPGETVAIVGKNGAGKTTLIKLLCRLYKPSDGRILINGRDIQNLSLEEYGKELSVVFQDFKLLPVKLNENITGKPEHLITEKDTEIIWGKAEETGIKSWIESQQNGLQSYLTKVFDDEGLLPSGGQEQKIAITRALMRDGSIVILDEPTAALDPKSEEEIFENLIGLTKGKTSIFISHRLSSTRIADRIIVLDNGEIIEEGNHEDLMVQEGLYSEMFNIQAEQYV